MSFKWDEEGKFLEEKQLHYVYKFLTENFVKEKNNSDFIEAYRYEKSLERFLLWLTWMIPNA
jgi:hypothetical protein